jgi:electron transfer flavoprotein-quinone oxidoreductase
VADEFDAIVVGAGFAGSACAIRLARGGASVLLLERGDQAGEKNLSGGILWGDDLAQILPEWGKSMPVERHLVRKRFGFLTADRAISFSLDDPSWANPPYVAHSVLRARTDPWLAKQAEAAGATVVTGVPVERLAWEGRRVRGIVQGGETMTAPVTVLCDGANSRLTIGTPIRPADRLSERATELGMKEVYALPPSAIEERFGLAPGEGHAEEWVFGGAPNGVMAGGFLYTNRDTLSVGLIVHIGSLFGNNAYSHDLLERFKLHPAIAARLGDAELVEYGAKLISSGWASRPTSFHGDGWLICGDAAGFVYANGIVIQGMNYAIRTGILAADAILEARTPGPLSGASLAGYTARLERSGVLPDFRGSEGLDRVKWNPRYYSTYPRLAAELLHRRWAGEDRSWAHLLAWAEEIRRGEKLPYTSGARDGFEAFRNL